MVVHRDTNENRRLSTIGINGEIPANDYNEIIPIHLDDKTRGIAISSASGATGRVGDFTVLAYHPELGYDLVWTIGVSGLYTFIAEHEIPVTVSQHRVLLLGGNCISCH